MSVSHCTERCTTGSCTTVYGGLCTGQGAESWSSNQRLSVSAPVEQCTEVSRQRCTKWCTSGRRALVYGRFSIISQNCTAGVRPKGVQRVYNGVQRGCTEGTAVTYGGCTAGCTGSTVYGSVQYGSVRRVQCTADVRQCQCTAGCTVYNSVRQV